MRTYTVQAGDSPWTIALRLTGDGNRWRELVKVNPMKDRKADGSFASLHAREDLVVPDSWPCVAPPGVAVRHTEAAHDAAARTRSALPESAREAFDAGIAASRAAATARASTSDDDSGVAWSTPSWEEP